MCPAPHPPPFCPLPPACATVAEVRKRGDEFWSEFEFYLSDLLVRQAIIAQLWYQLCCI